MEKLEKILKELDIWDIYNSFFLLPDIDRTRKFLVREHLFKLTLEKPGDIVELGVMKGIGLAQLVKLREIFIPGSSKKIIGFDLFSRSEEYKIKLENHHLNLDKYYLQCDVDMKQGIPKEKIQNLMSKIPGGDKNIVLIEGDVSCTIGEYLKQNPGFRISYLYLDMDIDEPTSIALELLYNRVVRGGIIVFDEYACDKWTESDAVDRFLAKHPELELKTVSFSKTPTAFIIKP